jgi:hypothetical protein
MRQLNAAGYIMIEGFGPVPDGLPGHRRVDHRLLAIPEGCGRTRPSPRTKPTRNAHSKRRTDRTPSRNSTLDKADVDAEGSLPVFGRRLRFLKIN